MNRRTVISLMFVFLSALFFLQGLSAQKKENVEGVIFSFVDTVPEFVGGRDALIAFLTNEMEFPEKASKQGIKKGKVYLEFVVKENGELVNIAVSKSTDKIFNKEAVRLLSIMPAWKPGVLNGNKVNSRYEFPIKFGYDCVLDSK